MDYIDKMIETGRIPLDERGVKAHGYKEHGVNYCIISHFRQGGFIEEKIEHMVTDDLNSLQLNKKEDETSSGLALDKENG